MTPKSQKDLDSYPGLRAMIEWEKLADGLDSANRIVPPNPEYVEALVEAVMECQTVLPAETKLYRARVHETQADLSSEPMPIGELGLAPASRVRAARLNPERLPYFYAALDPETAIAEVRPWRSARVSVGTFRVKVGLTVVDLRKEAAASTLNQHLIAVAWQLGRPVGNQDPKAYLPSQYLGQRIQAAKAFGVLFDSSLSQRGTNVALFSDYGLQSLSSELYRVEAVDIKASILQRIADD